jgi:hypothetical protein
MSRLFEKVQDRFDELDEITERRELTEKEFNQLQYGLTLMDKTMFGSDITKKEWKKFKGLGQ